MLPHKLQRCRSHWSEVSPVGIQTNLTYPEKGCHDCHWSEVSPVGIQTKCGRTRSIACPSHWSEASPVGIQTQVYSQQYLLASLGHRSEVSPVGIVRHVTHHSIPGAAGRNEEKGSWVIQSPLSRKVRGKAAYWKRHRDLTDDRGRGWQDPRGMSKATLPKVQSTVVENGAYGQASEAHTLLCKGLQSRLLHSPEERTMANEAIKADE